MRFLIFGFLAILAVGFAMPSFSERKADAAGEGKKYLISVGKPGKDAAWAKEACDQLHETIYNYSFGAEPSSKCFLSKPAGTASPELAAAIASGQYAYHIQLQGDSAGAHTLTVVNLTRKDETEFEKLQWKIAAETDWKVQSRKLLQNVFNYDLDRNEIKKLFLKQGVADSARLRLLGHDFIDSQTGKRVDFDTAYQIYSNESEKQKNYLRAGIEIVAMLGTGMANYYINKDRNARDWDFTTAPALRHRFTSFDDWRFDDNSIGVNSDHAFAGASYYLAARSNGLSAGESFLATFAASSTWEYLVEYREVVSINDQLVTTVGGFVIGESMHQLAKIFRRGNKNLINMTLGTIFDAPTALNSFMDGQYGKNKGGRYGFNEDFWARFDLEATLVSVKSPALESASAYRLGFNGQIMNIPMFEEPGHVRDLYTDTAFSQMILRKTANSGSLDEFQLFAKTVFAAYHVKNLGRDAHGDLQGYNLVVGPSSAIEMREEQNGNRKDFMTTVNVLGATLDMTVYMHGVKIRCTMDVFGDFALMRSYAIDSYRADHSLDGVQSVLRNQDYAYAVGVTTSLKLSAEYGKWSVGGNVSSHDYSNINGRSRFSEVVSQDLDVRDSRTDSELWVAYQVAENIKVRASVERTDRRGSIGGWGSVSGHETRAMGTLIYTFQ